jgi:hypothetical protein
MSPELSAPKGPSRTSEHAGGVASKLLYCAGAWAPQVGLPSSRGPLTELEAPCKLVTCGRWPLAMDCHSNRMSKTLNESGYRLW